MHIKQILSDPKAREKPCLRCGLSLRKRLDDRHCPECGLSVWMSLNQNDSLAYSNPRWLRAASRGAWLLAIIQPLALLAYVIAIYGAGTSSLLAAFSEYEDPDAAATTMPVEADSPDPEQALDQHMRATLGAYQPPPPSIPVAIAAGVMGIYFVLNAGGMALLTVHEHRHPDRVRTARTVAQVSAGVTAGLGVLLVVLCAVNLPNGWPMGTIGSWFALLVIEIAFAVCAGCICFWLKRIAQRGGHSALGRLCGYLLFLPLVPLLKAAPFFGIWFLYLLSPLFYLLPIVYVPLSIFLCLRCARMLARAAPEAEEAWARETIVAHKPPMFNANTV